MISDANLSGLFTTNEVSLSSDHDAISGSHVSIIKYDSGSKGEMKQELDNA